jgi:hypothetical protein
MLLFGWRHLFFWVQVRYIWDFECSVFVLILIFDLLTLYFAVVVWWVSVAAAAEYRYFGELFLFLDVLVVLQYFMIGVFCGF